MKIYLDYIFFENFLVNFLLLTIVCIFTKSQMKKINKLIAVTIASLYTSICVYLQNDFLTNIIIKVLMIAITVYIAFIPKTIIEYIKKQIYFYTIYFSYVGIIIAITLLFNISINRLFNKMVVYMISALLLYIFNQHLWKMWKRSIQLHNLTYTLNIDGIEINAFVDTGNTVKDCVTNLDVIFLESQWYHKLKEKDMLKEKMEIEYNTAISKTISNGYIIKNVRVYKEQRYITTISKIAVSFIQEAMHQKEYSALIGYNTYMEELKGVSLC